MLKRLLIVGLLLFPVLLVAQEGTTSPYSFFGIGSLKFKGTVENRSMGGLSVYSDSIHINVQNPAGISRLRLVNYSIAGSHKFNTLSTETESERATTTTLDYMAMGIPMGKFGASFGLLPFTSSGYKLESVSENSTTQYSGEGGLNKIFVALAYQINKNFSVGVETNYDFGSIENTAESFQDEIQYGTREINRSDILGFSFVLGAQYVGNLNNGLEVLGSATYTPETDFESENSRTIATIFEVTDNNFTVVDERDILVNNTDFTFPSQWTLGAGIGRSKKWFLGAEVTSQKTSNFTNRTFELENVIFEDATKIRFGGFFIPDYNSFTKYWKRIVYRGGFRFEETGLNINGESINEFGISFGLGIPLRRSFSNINLGFELGQRGTKNQGLVQENFFNFFVSLSLNDKWFEKRYFN